MTQEPLFPDMGKNPVVPVIFMMTMTSLTFYWISPEKHGVITFFPGTVCPVSFLNS
jgi:hypothetical protein